MRWEGPSEASGLRAARLLPCCFALLEGATEALALDTQAAEEEEEEEEARAGGARREQETGGSSDDAAAAAAVLPPAVAQRALYSLQASRPCLEYL